jgi:hypothetical protein
LGCFATTCFGRYIVLSTGAADALALYVKLPHCFEAFQHVPRLSCSSPDKQCAKTLTLDVAGYLVARPLRAENISAAVLFRLVEGYKPTLLLDEVDTYLKENEELRGILNAGHKRGGKAYRCEGEKNVVGSFNDRTLDDKLDRALRFPSPLGRLPPHSPAAAVEMFCQERCDGSV